MFPSAWFNLDRDGAVLVIVALGMLPSVLWRRPDWAIFGLLLLPLAHLLPFRHGSVFDLVASVYDAPSAAGLLLLGGIVWSAILAPDGDATRRALMPLAGVVALLGMAFYPAALGFGAFDPYRLGFAGAWLPIACLAGAAAALALGARSVMLWLGLAAFINFTGLHPSGNLWDHLVDPIAVVAALLMLGARKFNRAVAPRSAPGA